MTTRSKTCRRTKSGPCARLSGHKGDCRPTLTRQPKAVEVASADRYTVIAEVEPKVRLGISGPVGQPKAAKRAKRAPASTRSRSNAGALKGRLAKTECNDCRGVAVPYRNRKADVRCALCHGLLWTAAEFAARGNRV